MHRDHDDTPWLLEQWARWAWTGHGLKLRYPNMTPFRRLSKTTSQPGPMISDLCAQEIDAAVSKVYGSNREVGNCLVRRYLLRQTYHRIGRAMRMTRQRASALCRIGEAAVSELLDAD
jgi:hypothetical protein